MRRNDKIYDAKNFLYIAAMPKAASSLMWLVLSAIQEPNNRPDPSKIRDAMGYDFLPLTPEYLETFSRGGVVKNHAPIEYHNDRFFKQTGCKYVVLVRHPADQMAALYCHIRAVRHKAFLNHAPVERRTPWDFSLGQFPTGTFDDEPEIAISRLIETGYLFKSLMWVADWATFRHPEQSRLLRYEDIVSDFAGMVTMLCQFIRGTPPDDDLMEYLRHVFDHEANRNDKKSDLEKYPHGWTGRVGIWSDYFSKSNIEAYNRSLERFLKAYPHAGAVTEIYHNLTIAD